MITARQMIPLRPRRPPLTLLTARQLLKSSVQFFDLPTHVAGIVRHLRCQGLIEVIRNDPVHVAVWGDQLEQPYRKGHFFPLDHHALGHPVGRPLERCQMDIPLLLAQLPRRLLFRVVKKSGYGDESPSDSPPTRTSHRTGSCAPGSASGPPRGQTSLGNGGSWSCLHVRGIHAIVKRIEVRVFARAVYQTHNPNPPHPPCSLPLYWARTNSMARE